MNRYPITLLFLRHTYRFSYTDPHYRYRSILFKYILEDGFHPSKKLKSYDIPNEYLIALLSIQHKSDFKKT